MLRKTTFAKIILISLYAMIASSSFAMETLVMPENPLIGKEAPDFTLDTTLRKDVNMTQYRDGQNAIIFLWATWCPHCRSVLEQLSDQSRTFASQGIKLILVDLGENKRVVEECQEVHNVNLEVFLDTETAIADRYAVVGVPTLVFVNQQGIVQAVEHILPQNYQTLFTDNQ